MVSESTGGVAPIEWIHQPEVTLIDTALNDYDVVWDAAGHPHAVFQTSYTALVRCTGAQPMKVGE